MRHAAERGFTITELLIVLVVVGILTSLGLPMFLSAWRASAVRAGAEELASVLNGARQLALNRNATVCVTLGTGTVQYRPGTCVATPVTEVRLANNVTVSTVQNVTFTHLGAASPAATYTVTNPQDGGSLGVSVTTSGRVRIGP